MNLLLGKEIALQIKENIKKQVEALTIKPKLVVLVNEEDTSSLGYVAMLEKNAISLGISFEKILMQSNETHYVDTITKLNLDDKVSAIMVTRPLFKGANEKSILSHIDASKDVDVMNTSSLGDILVGLDSIAPATATAIIKMLEFNHIEIKGKNCLVIGRSISVGKPVALMLLNRHGTVTIAHSRTVNLDEHVRNADIVVCAVGIPHFLDLNKVKDDAIVIDAGIHYLEDGRVVGDVLPREEKQATLSKVPGGVGAVTTASLLENVLKLHMDK